MFLVSRDNVVEGTTSGGMLSDFY